MEGQRHQAMSPEQTGIDPKKALEAQQAGFARMKESTLNNEGETGTSRENNPEFFAREMTAISPEDIAKAVKESQKK